MESRRRLIQDIFESMMLLKRRIAKPKRFLPGAGDLPPAQGIVLRIVAMRESLSVKEIAELLQVSGSAVTQIVDALVKAGLLMRETNPEDRRTLRLSLTGEGRSKLEEFKKTHLENLGLILTPLSEPELETLRDLILKILNHNFQLNE
jgi:DNA-binding MarR family transcriptional regulator